jgi:hypothetical protein
VDQEETFHDDVKAALEQLRDEPAPAPDRAATDVGDQISDHLDAQDERAEQARLDQVERTEEGKRRDNRGRFASKAEQEAHQSQHGTQPPIEQQLQNIDPNKPPNGWSAEARAAFNRLPPAVREAVIKREQDVSNGFRQYAERFRDLEPVRQMMEPRRQSFQRFGIKSDAEAINHLLSFSDAYQRDPAGLIRHLVQSAGLTPVHVFGQGGGMSQQQLEGYVRERIMAEDAKRTVAEYERKPPEHYHKVRSTMRDLLWNGQAEGMQDAYNKAIKLHPDLVVDRKRRAASASLSGAPHGAQNSRGQARSHGDFREITDDVRAAISQLS